MAFLESTTNYFKEVRQELRKVSWPTKQDTINYTWAVIGMSVAVAIFLGALDYLFTQILNFFLFR